ncbi:TonB-dependent receptor [Rhodovarius crocodyli]|uniref:TonB-dependent receptor n=1 Tax=Rhodovarius crocodyli TaxID=1979269 RepID=A0A437MNG6_9PROT|nr:TonB-dependent receptor [Rhodovarius crocodyli]RVT99188.1 TonB-dependent receptor [Rhodovarius crocodyli]
MRRVLLLGTTALSLASLSASPALAQIALPDTVVTATRVATDPDRVPVATTTITRQDIEERGYQTLPEALAAVPGLRLVPQGGPGTLTSGFFRGTNSRHVRVLLDGVPMNDAADPNGAFNFGSFMLAGIERIEVLRGPASSLYGSDAIGGVVNIITRRPPAGKVAEVFGSIAGGTQSTFRGDGGVAGTLGAFDYLFAMQHISTEGFNITPQRLTTNRGERDGYRGTAALARLGYQVNPDTRIEGTLRWQQANYGLDRFLADDPNYSAEDRRWSGQVRAETRLFDGLWTTGLRVGYTDDRRRAVNLPDQYSSSRTDDLYRGSRTMVDWGNQIRLPAIGGVANDGLLSFGVNWQHETSNSAFGNAPFRGIINRTQESTAGYVALQYRVLERLDLSAGGRVDAVAGFGETPTYRLGAVYHLPEFNTRLRAAIGSGFAAPSLFQRYGVQGSFRGNPDLRPERSTSWEFGADVDVPGFGNPRLVTAGFTYFNSHFRDLINSNATFTSYTNVARANIEGAEFSFTGRIAPWAEARLAYTLTRAFDSTTDRQLLRRPQDVVSLGATLRPIRRLTVAPELIITGRAADYVYTNSGASSGRTNTPGGITANLTVTYQAMDQVSLFMEARNLGNSRYEPTSGYVTPGRSVLFGTRFAL